MTATDLAAALRTRATKLRAQGCLHDARVIENALRSALRELEASAEASPPPAPTTPPWELL